MPDSSLYFSSGDERRKWRKRRREPQINLTQKQEDEDEDEDDHPYPQSGSAPDPCSKEIEVSPNSGVPCSDFPLVMKRILNRLHRSVRGIVALERANEFGEGKGQAQGSSFSEIVPHGQLQTLSAVPPDNPPSPIIEGCGVVKHFGSRSHVVPMHSDWFSLATVNRLERQAVPHFFSGKSPDHTPEKYMECRNYAVIKYTENPERMFTEYDFIGVVAGIETENLSQIVRFLDHWGIINYCVTAPCHEKWNSSSYLIDESTGTDEIHVASAALKSIDCLFKFDRPKCNLKAAVAYSSLSCHYNNVFDLDNRICEHLFESHCSSCSQSLPTVCYQSHKEVDIMLCSNCFYDGRSVIGHSSLDFTRMDSAKGFGDLYGEIWTDQETLLLLEAVEMYNENWKLIADHVGAKSKTQCILHFLRLPVKDGLVDSIEVPRNLISSSISNEVVHGGANSIGSCNQDVDYKSRFPFADSGNPVMSLVAFLASSVCPRVAAACAHASLAALSEDCSLYASENLLQKQGLRQSSRMNSEIFQGQTANSVHHKENKSTIIGSRRENEAGATPLSAENVKAAAQAGLAAASTKAKLFADHEEREIQRLSANVIKHQLKRLELKLKQFAQVETLLINECEQVERARERLLAQRSHCMASWMGARRVPFSLSLPATAGSSLTNDTGDSRQQTMLAPPSQPSISGYNNQPQQVHPHMPFMLQQQMFALGPRLPLAAIQSPSTALPNVMYNSSGNSQPNTSFGFAEK